MALISSRVVMKDEPQGWRKLWEQAQRERDPKKLDAIIKQVNRLLTEYENRALARARGDEPVSDLAPGLRRLSKVDKLVGSD